MNPWVAHANRSVYGEDADVFRPERWLEEGSSDGETKIEQYFFTVSGSRVILVLSDYCCPRDYFLGTNTSAN